MNLEDFYNGLDQLFAQNRIGEIEQYLIKGLADATAVTDARACLSILNEMISFYLSREEYQSAVTSADQALTLCQALKLEGTAAYASTLMNAAAAYRAAGKFLEAIPFYEETEQIYKENLKEGDLRFASLYNEMSLLYQELKENELAAKMLMQTMEILKKLPGTQMEQAVTMTNLAMNYHMMSEEENAFQCLDFADGVYKEEGGLSPQYGASLTLRGQIYMDQKEYLKAVEQYEAALMIIEANFGKNETYQMVVDTVNKVKKMAENQ